MSTRVEVALGPRSYPVLVQTHCLPQLGATLRTHGLAQTNAFVLTNPDVAALYFSTLETSLKNAGFQRIVRHEIPASEEGKNWDVFSATCAALLEHFPDAGASPLVLLLGGGVVGDLGGFAAAVYRRGVPFVQIPTTLLAAVDSSVGGKVAVNFGGVKNIMGAFSQPRLVFCDLATLKTLSPRELRSGTAEVIKYGAVCSQALFDDLEAGALEKLLAQDPETLVDIVARCVQLKANVVAQDEFDKLGIRNVLNFGHTIGHALEAITKYRRFRHGEAIGYGMLAAGRISQWRSLMSEAELNTLRHAIRSLGPMPAVTDLSIKDALAAITLDKKVISGKLHFVAAKGLGATVSISDVTTDELKHALRDIGLRG